MMRLAQAILCLLLGACASYGGRGLLPGEARLADVLRVMGTPAMQWRNADDSRQLAYPRGPSGVHTFMVRLAADGRLEAIDNVLDATSFAQIQRGMVRDQVLRLIGPSEPAWTIYYPARDELVWVWRFCSDWNEAARFHVLFDGREGPVRSTMILTEAQLGVCGSGEGGGCWCAR